LIGSPETIKHSPQVATVFTWKKEKGGKNVYIAGNFNDWKEKIQMNESHGDFTTIQTLAPGTYQYRYVVDGKWATDPESPLITDINGETYNLLEIKRPEETILLKRIASTPPGLYNQDQTLPQVKTQSDSPPGLPPHLLRALLNTEPHSIDPTVLPLPHHVMLNHLYSFPRQEEKMMIMGVTQRYKEKFLTTVYYKPLET